MPHTYFGTYGHQWETFAEQTGSNAGNWACGHKLILPDAREYAFGLVDGTTATAAGKLYQSVASVALHTNRACDVLRAIGAKAISATLGATLAAIDIYSEGIVHTNSDGGEGYAYRIRRAIAAGDAHAAAAASNVLTVNLEAGETVQVALAATTSDVSFSRNRFHSVIIHPAPPTAQLAGVAPGIQAVSTWGWFQIKGAAAVLADGTLLEGNHAQATINDVDGAVENRKIRVRTGATTAADSTIGAKATDQDGSEVSVVLMGTTISTTYDVTAGIAYNAPLVGEIIEANADTEYGLIELDLPG